MFRKLFFNLYYFFNPPWDTGVSPPELYRFIETHQPGRALDIGCGTGTNVITLAQHDWNVTGVDFAHQAVRIGRRKAKRAKVSVKLMVGDASKLKGINGTFDLILDIGCFHSLSNEERRSYLKNLAHLLSPGGVYLLYAFFRTRDSQGPGLLPEDLDTIGEVVDLIRREDGFNRGEIPSVWMTYQAPSERV